MTFIFAYLTIGASLVIVARFVGLFRDPAVAPTDDTALCVAAMIVVLWPIGLVVLCVAALGDTVDWFARWLRRPTPPSEAK